MMHFAVGCIADLTDIDWIDFVMGNLYVDLNKIKNTL